MSKRRVIIDLDVGTDDAFALLVLLHAEKLGQLVIEAIVCTAGNTSLDNVCKNVVRLLELLHRTDIPIYRGAFSPLNPVQKPLAVYHGTDGFGDLQYDTNPDLSIIKKVPATVAIHDIVTKAPQECTLICIGPLTTAALTMKVYDDFASNLRDIFIMGGSYKVGNATEFAEFNFYFDPEAANIVLKDKAAISIVTWETCLESDITFEWRYLVLGKCVTPFMELLNRAERSVYINEKLTSIWQPCDAFTIVAMLYPDAVLKKSIHSATVDLHHPEKRGLMILDEDNSKPKNVTIVESLNISLLREVLVNATKQT